MLQVSENHLILPSTAHVVVIENKAFRAPVLMLNRHGLDAGKRGLQSKLVFSDSMRAPPRSAPFPFPRAEHSRMGPGSALALV